MKKTFLLSLILCSVFMACNNKKKITAAQTESSSTEKNPDMNVTSPMMKNADVVITNKYWKAIEIMGEKVVLEEDSNNDPYFQMQIDGTFKGNGGCNSLFGSYNRGVKNLLTFKDISMTEMECEGNNYDEKLFQALELTQQFILIGEDQLQLIVGKRAPLAIFEAVYFD